VRMEVPTQIKEKLQRIRGFIQSLRKSYGENLDKWGRPYFTKEELIALLYAQNVLDIPDTVLERLTDISRVSLRKLREKFESGKQICYLLEDRENMECKVFTVEEVRKIVEEWLKPKKPWAIEDLAQSEVIRNFQVRPIKRSKRARKYHDVKLSPRQVTEILTAYGKVIQKLKEKGFRFTNPDVWLDVLKGSTDYGITKEELENAIYDAIKDICRYSSHYESCVKGYVVKLRAIEPLYVLGFMKGYAGASKAKPKSSTKFISLEDIAKLKEAYRTTEDSRLRACIMIALLHIETGAREGYASLLTSTSMDLDNAPSSLIGIKFENVIWGEDGRAVGLRVLETKTEREWILSQFWLNPEFSEILPKLRDLADKKGIKSIVKAILAFHGINRVETVRNFELFYRSCVNKIGKLLGKELRPHDLRASHISLLADLGVPLEVAVNPQSGFGVGWEDLKTAVEHYWIISQKRLAQYYALVREHTSKLPSLTP
jgi:Phage integrase family.